ncbi:MAG: M42 family metallopeptidase [Luteolibacter sp.]
MKTKALTLLKELTEAHSVPGHEDEVRAIFCDELAGLGEISSDRTGSVFCTLPGAGPRVLIAGHMDEVGFMVQNITPDGFLQFVTLGGWWEHNLLSQRIEVLTRSGTKIPGVIASKPPHFLGQNQRREVMSVEHMFIDVGAGSRIEVERDLGISLGDPIAPWVPFVGMGIEGRFMAKAFDNRVGMAAAIQAGQILAEDGDAPNHLILCGTVQEEVGTRGARTAANHAKPDVAIILEGPPADDIPGFPRIENQGRLGGGVQIRMFDPSAIGNPRLAHLAIDTAREAGIPHQVAVRRSGGTDAAAFHLASEGIPSVVLGTPARYIHSHNAIIDVQDQLALVALTIELAKKLDARQVAGLTRYF